MKFQFNTQMCVIFCTVFAGLCILVGFDKLDPKYLGILLTWLIPAPFQVGQGEQQP
jgi:hypothetical protein